MLGAKELKTLTPPRPTNRHYDRRPIWCVELQRYFPTAAAAARFVERSPANLIQAIVRNGRCGRYSWEHYNPRRHRPIRSGNTTGDS
jgi:hypothetical protein